MYIVKQHLQLLNQRHFYKLHLLNIAKFIHYYLRQMTNDITLNIQSANLYVYVDVSKWVVNLLFEKS